jgi:NAD(P)-dependent dehydrogenase (short-subunit alcohol dehydrogenase family)
MTSVLITGSNCGIGLEFARQYAQSGWRVFATCRRPAEAAELHELAGQHPGLSVHRLDVTVPDDIRAIVWELDEAAASSSMTVPSCPGKRDYPA